MQESHVVASAHQPRIPVYAVSDSSRICSDIMALELETGFDIIPADHLTGIITEDGLIEREEINAYLAGKLSRA